MNDDPYRVLGLPPDTDDDAQIRTAYHALVRAGRADAQINAAYAAIRKADDRRQHRWTCATAIVGELPRQASRAPDLDALIRELVSLSDWELGEPA